MFELDFDSHDILHRISSQKDLKDFEQLESHLVGKSFTELLSGSHYNFKTENPTILLSFHHALLDFNGEVTPENVDTLCRCTGESYSQFLKRLSEDADYFFQSASGSLCELCKQDKEVKSKGLILQKMGYPHPDKFIEKITQDLSEYGMLSKFDLREIQFKIISFKGLKVKIRAEGNFSKAPFKLVKEELKDFLAPDFKGPISFTLIN